MLAAALAVACSETTTPSSSPAPNSAPQRDRIESTAGDNQAHIATPSSLPRPTGPLPADFSLRLVPVVRGLDRPTYATAPAGDPRLFVLEQSGRVRIVKGGVLLPEPFLDLSDKVLSGGERGLLGLAFHPRYSDNGRFFVHYSAQPDGDTQVEEYRVSADPDRADPMSAISLLTVDQPAPVHNGGMLTFGPDGMLYLGLGDGGPGNDPREEGQNPSTLLGKILRLDPNGRSPGLTYAVPPDNPFTTGGGAPEVWAYGLRNPWRFSFDSVEGMLYIGDVGQYRFEEINVVSADHAGANFGWSVREGSHCFPDLDACQSQPLIDPLVEYPHQPECAVIGGYVYNGVAMPALRGHYFYSDLCAGWLRSFRLQGGQAVDPRDWTSQVGKLPFPTSFGTDGSGELYVTAGDGTVYQLVAAQ